MPKREQSYHRSNTISRSEPAFVSKQVTEARRYYLNLTPDPQRNIGVVCGGVERCRADYVIHRSRFPFYAIEFVAEGNGTLNLAGRDYTLRPGTAFAYGGAIEHTIRNDPLHPMLKYYVDFSGSDAEQLLKKTPLGTWQIVQVSSSTEVLSIFESLQNNGLAHTPYSEEICAHLLSVLFLKISEKAIAFGNTPTRSHPTYERARQYIAQHYLELKTIEEAAEACHLDPAYLSRLFQRFDHQSPYHFLMSLKMNRAAELLLDSGKLIKEVAADLNFADPYHFSRVFKRTYGISPEQFVKQGYHMTASSQS